MCVLLGALSFRRARLSPLPPPPDTPGRLPTPPFPGTFRRGEGAGPSTRCGGGWEGWFGFPLLLGRSIRRERPAVRPPGPSRAGPDWGSLGGAGEAMRGARASPCRLLPLLLLLFHRTVPHGEFWGELVLGALPHAHS